jgi:hypothetical protein
MSMEKHLYRGNVKGRRFFNPLLDPEVAIWWVRVHIEQRMRRKGSP